MDEDTRAIWANEASSKPRRSCPRAVPPRGEMTNTEDRETGWLSYIAFVILAIGAFFLMIRSDLLWTEHETDQRTSFHELSSWSQSWQVNSIQNDDPLALTSYFIEKDLPLPSVSTYRLVNICPFVRRDTLTEDLREPQNTSSICNRSSFASYSARRFRFCLAWLSHRANRRNVDFGCLLLHDNKSQQSQLRSNVRIERNGLFDSRRHTCSALGHSSHDPPPEPRDTN